MMLDSPHTSVPMLMRGNTPPTTRSPPITSSRKPTQPTTRHSRRGRTGREGPDVEADVDEGGPRLQAATDRAACADAPQQHQPPQQQDAVHSELRPGTGKGASARAGPPRRATRPGAGPGRAAPGDRRCRRPPRRPSPTRHASPPTTTGWRKGGCPIVSTRS